MTSFNYIIKDKTGIHARPAGMLAKTAKEFDSRIIIKAKGKQADAERLMAVMGLGIVCGDEIKVEITGSDEKSAILKIEEFFKANL